MFHKKTIFTLGILGLILTSGIATASAFSGDGQGFLGKGQDGNTNRPTQMEEIFENGDYDAWVEIMSNRPIANNSSVEISEATFAKLQEAHEAMQSGDYETARAIREELGFSYGERPNRNHMSPEDRDEINAAITSGDYEAWLELVGDRPVSEIITADNFSTFQAMHEAMQSGDYDTAEELREELGLPERGSHRMPGGRGQHQSSNSQNAQ